MGAFLDAAPAWAAAGIVPLPITPDGKRPMVRGPETFGRPAALKIAAKPKFANAALGFWCGHFNRLTVVDIDSPQDSELSYALDVFGPSPIIAETPSGGRHIYYRHDGERRSIRPIEGHPIDILGGGLCVAPPSVRPAGGRYAFLRGGVPDVPNLPKICVGALQKLQHAPSRADDDIQSSRGQPTRFHQLGRVPKGERNVQLFRYCNSVVGCCDDLDQLIDAARTWADSKCAEPLHDAEIVATAYKVWKYQGGRKRVMQNIVEGPLFQRLIADVEVWALYAYLATENGPAAQFMVADGLGLARNWPRRMVPRARRALLDMGAIKCVRHPRKGTPGLYCWASPPAPMREGGGDKGLHTNSGRPCGGLP